MKDDLIKKIERIVANKGQINEESIRLLMVLIRKLLEMQQPHIESFLTLNLFCNWAMHIEITYSNTGLRILAEINDALVRNKDAEVNNLQLDMSQAIGFSKLRSELKLFFNNNEIDDIITYNNTIWVNFVCTLIEIIRDVPLSFPKLSELDKTKKKIYNRIAQNPIKLGAGVISIVITKIDNNTFGECGVGKRVCLHISIEDKITIIIPMLLDARL